MKLLTMLWNFITFNRFHKSLSQSTDNTNFSYKEFIIKTAKEAEYFKNKELKAAFTEDQMRRYCLNIITYIVKSNTENYVLISYHNICLPREDMILPFYRAFKPIAKEVGLDIEMCQGNYIKVEKKDISSFMNALHTSENNIFHTGVYR